MYNPSALKRFIRHSGFSPLCFRRQHVMRPKVSRFGEANQSYVPHQVADPAMQVCSCVVDIFSVLDADQVRNLGWVIRTPIPSRHAAAANCGINPQVVLSLRHRLHTLVDVILPPGNSVRLVEPYSKALRPHEKWRGSSYRVHSSLQRTDKAASAIGIRSAKRGGANDQSVILQPLQVTIRAVRKRKSNSVFCWDPTQVRYGAIRQWLP